MSKEKLSRREFLLGASALAAGGILAACAPPSAPAPEKPAEAPEEATEAPAEAPAEEEGVAIQYWAHWGAYTSAWKQIETLEEYAEVIGNNTVELKSPFSAETLLTAIAGGEPPDAASGLHGQYPDYMARGVLFPVGELVAASTIIGKESFLEGAWNNSFWKGTQLAVPANEGFVRFGLIYNARLAEEAGLDPDSPPLTWDECMQWHKALTQFDDAGNLVQVGLDPYDAMGGRNSFANGFFSAASWGWDWFDEEAGTFDLNNEKMAEAFEVMGEFYRFVGPDNMAGMRQVEGQGTWGPAYWAEVQAMIIEGNWQPGWVAQNKPEVSEVTRATWAPVPASRSGTRLQGYGGHYVVLFKDAPHPELGFKVAELVNTNAACDALFKTIGFLPALKPYLETVDPMTYPGLDFYFRSVEEATYWHTPALCPMTDYVNNQHVELREKVYRGEMTGAEAAEEFQRRCEEEWKAAGFS